MKRTFYASFLSTLAFVWVEGKTLSGFEGRLTEDLEKNFTTGLLTGFHYFVHPELIHFLFWVLPPFSRNHPFFLFIHVVNLGVAIFVQM